MLDVANGLEFEDHIQTKDGLDWCLPPRDFVSTLLDHNLWASSSY